jgi:hypothetical protein
MRGSSNPCSTKHIRSNASLYEATQKMKDFDVEPLPAAARLAVETGDTRLAGETVEQVSLPT